MNINDKNDIYLFMKDVKSVLSSDNLRFVADLAIRNYTAESVIDKYGEIETSLYDIANQASDYVREADAEMFAGNVK
jgi:hypothetical protein